MKYKKKKSRDPVAQAMNENHGAFSMKIINAKKGKYVRERIDLRRISSKDADEDESSPIGYSRDEE